MPGFCPASGITFSCGRKSYWSIFTPQPLRLWGIVITRGRQSGGRSGGRAVRNLALTEKLPDEFCLFFTDITHVPGQFIPDIFFLAPSHKRQFSKLTA